MLIAVSLSLSLSLSLPREQSSSRRVAGNKHPPAGGRTRQRHGGEKLTRRALVGAKRIQARVPLQPSPPCSNALHACIFGSVRQLQRHARTRRERTCECTCFCKYAVSSLSLSLSLSLSVSLSTRPWITITVSRAGGTIRGADRPLRAIPRDR